MKLKSKFEFLNEGRSQEINFEEVKDLIRTYCQQWLNKKDEDQFAIFRGIKSDQNFLKIDPSIYTRTSLNQKDNSFYFPIIDRWKDFPKRSKSIICTSVYNNAKYFGDIYIVIPYDDAKLTVCKSDDIWQSNEKYELNLLNDNIKYIIKTFVSILKDDSLNINCNNYDDIVRISNFITDNFESFKTNMVDYCRTHSPESRIITDIIKSGSLLKFLESELTPENLECYTINYKKFTKLFTANEIWTDSKAILIQYTPYNVTDLRNFVKSELKN